jgi:hypothetical protein
MVFHHEIFRSKEYLEFESRLQEFLASNGQEALVDALEVANPLIVSSLRNLAAAVHNQGNLVT